MNLSPDKHTVCTFIRYFWVTHGSKTNNAPFCCFRMKLNQKFTTVHWDRNKSLFSVSGMNCLCCLHEQRRGPCSCDMAHRLARWLLRGLNGQINHVTDRGREMNGWSIIRPRPNLKPGAPQPAGRLLLPGLLGSVSAPRGQPRRRRRPEKLLCALFHFSKNLYRRILLIFCVRCAKLI